MKKTSLILLFYWFLSSFTTHQKLKPKTPKAKQACEYEQKMREQGLVNIQEIDPSILVELKYSTTDNFVGKDVYGCITQCFMQKHPAEMFSKEISQLSTFSL
jgi:D-alanyl-D-alanine dipeptidase